MVCVPNKPKRNPYPKQPQQLIVKLDEEQMKELSGLLRSKQNAGMPHIDTHGTTTAELANEIFANMFKAGMHSKKELVKYAGRVVAEMYAHPEMVELLKELLEEARNDKEKD